jgi:hypothetical protein
LEKTTTLLESAGRWFMDSGIQQENGGVARYYRTDLRKNALVSTEITGYAASFLVYLYDLTGSAEYLEAGLRAARFLVRTAWDARLDVFPFEHSSNGAAPSPLAYFFDSGIIIRGLLSAWRATRESEFLETALRAGRGMMLHFSGPSTIHPILTLPEREPRPYEKRWSTSPGCYQLKAAMAWHDLYEAAGDRHMLAAYEAALEGALATQHEFLSSEPDSAKLMDRLHAYAYFLEGLLPRANDPACARTLTSGIDCIALHASEIAPSFARSDVYAQLLRIRLFCSELGVAPLDESAAAREADAAVAFQFQSDDPRIAGGFGFGTQCGEMMPFVNPVSTAFCVQAITLWEQYQYHQLKVDRRALV